MSTTPTNKSYTDWDNVIVQINLGDSSCGNIRMMRQDIEAMCAAHGSSTGEVLELLLKTLAEEAQKKIDATS